MRGLNFSLDFTLVLMENSAIPKILMFGWEFPPFNSGGLGVACEGLVSGLAKLGAQITFVLPKKLDCHSGSCKFVFSDEIISKEKYCAGVKTVAVNSPLSPYLTGESYEKEYPLFGEKNISIINRGVWRQDLMGEVIRYSVEARRVAAGETFDVVHCHDWLSIPAGLEVKKMTGKPLVFQVHATEYDRGGNDYMNQDICFIEKKGLEIADAVVAVSDYTKRRIVDCYGINPDKIKVVPNAIDRDKYPAVSVDEFSNLKRNGKKIVLFVGRLTFQKGPDYFLQAAKKVSQIDPNIMFVFSGSGDMERHLIEEAARLELSDKIVFAGFLRGDDLNRLYRMADIYVMPSVSEPFGLTSLEAIANGTPILVSRQSGVGEMISHCLKVDFWDVNEMANKILAVTTYSELRETLHCNGSLELEKFSWAESAEKCLGVYRQVLTA